MIPMTSVVADQLNDTPNRVDSVEADQLNDTPNRVDLLSILKYIIPLICFIVIFILPVAIMQNSPISGNNGILFRTQKPTPNHVHSKIQTDWLLIIMMMITISAIVFISLVEPLASSSIKGSPKSQQDANSKEIEMITLTLTPTPNQ